MSKRSKRKIAAEPPPQADLTAIRASLENIEGLLKKAIDSPEAKSERKETLGLAILGVFFGALSVLIALVPFGGGGGQPATASASRMAPARPIPALDENRSRQDNQTMRGTGLEGVHSPKGENTPLETESADFD